MKIEELRIGQRVTVNTSLDGRREDVRIVFPAVVVSLFAKDAAPYQVEVRTDALQGYGDTVDIDPAMTVCVSLGEIVSPDETVKRAGRWVKFDGDFSALKKGDKVRVDLPAHAGYPNYPAFVGETKIREAFTYCVTVDVERHSCGWYVSDDHPEEGVITEVWVP